MASLGTSLLSLNSKPPPPVMGHSYIRIAGQARFNEKSHPFIVAYNIENITNPCEINRHFLEVIQDTLLLEKRKSNTLQMRCGDLNVSTISGIGGSAFDQASSAVMSGFTEVQRAVLFVLNKYGRKNDGLKRFEVHNYMIGTSKSIIDEAISFLANEGHIFTTVDDDTLKSTDC